MPAFLMFFIASFNPVTDKDFGAATISMNWSQEVNYSHNWLIVLVTFQVKIWKLCLFQLLKFDNFLNHINERVF